MENKKPAVRLWLRTPEGYVQLERATEQDKDRLGQRVVEVIANYERE